MKTHVCEYCKHLSFLKKGGSGLTLKERRVNSGLRQEDVAKKLNVGQGAVSRWESGETKPVKKHRAKLAKLYGCTMDDLLSEAKK